MSAVISTLYIYISFMKMARFLLVIVVVHSIANTIKVLEWAVWTCIRAITSTRESFLIPALLQEPGFYRKLNPIWFKFRPCARKKERITLSSVCWLFSLVVCLCLWVTGWELSGDSAVCRVAGGYAAVYALPGRGAVGGEAAAAVLLVVCHTLDWWRDTTLQPGPAQVTHTVCKNE